MTATTLDRTRLTTPLDKERERFASTHPASLALAAKGEAHLLGGVPMGWMRYWPTPFPLVVREAHGARLVDVDGHEYIDFCLGEGGSMVGHAPPPVAAAIAAQSGNGYHHLLSSEAALWVAAELSRRFGLPKWHFALTATDANRFMLRLLRTLTGRNVVVVFEGCYHGTVDEALDTERLDSGESGLPRRVIPFNDVPALEAALAPGDVACVLTEPAHTNVGIVFPEPGFHDALRALTRQHGARLVIDETHTISAGPGGCTAAWGLQPDVFVIGKAIGGGIPSAAYGFTAELAAQIEERGLDHMDGTGGTLAGNVFSLVATRATLSDILTEDNFSHTTSLAQRFAAGVDEVIRERGLPWRTATLGCRVEYAFGPKPRSGGESIAALDWDLSSLLRLHAINRGVVLTPFLSNIALMCPATTEADVDRHTEVFAAAVDDLVG